MLNRAKTAGGHNILRTVPTGAQSPEALKALILESLDADKAEDIDTIDLKGQTALADFMIIATGRSSRQVGALAEKLQERIKAYGYGEARIEGREQCNWVIVDAGDIIVHIFRPEVRAFYNLEGMWTAFTAPHEPAAVPAP